MKDPLPESWEILRQWLPDNLQERARSSGFLQRARGIQDAELWLRIILMHVAGGLSLEQTAVRVSELGWAKLSAVAIFKRLQRAEPWLEQLTAWLLEQQRRLLGEVSWPKGWRIRAIDASDICEPGSTGTDWRLHYSIRLPEMTCDHFELTDAKGGEKLGRFSFESGDLALADRGYSHRGGFAHVLRSNADVLVRWSPHLFPVLDVEGNRWDPMTWLRGLKDNRASERKVWFEHAGERFELRELRAITYIVGSLGSGKTRLARRLAEALPGGVFVGLDRLEEPAGWTRPLLEADAALRARVGSALAWLAEEGADITDALLAMVVTLEGEGDGARGLDMLEQGLDEAAQSALLAHLRRRGPLARPVFAMTRSCALLDLAAVGPHELILLCPANHSPPSVVAPYPGAPGYEAVATCLASPAVRARTAGLATTGAAGPG